MKDFIYGLYQNDNFTLILVIAISGFNYCFCVSLFLWKERPKVRRN